MQNLLEYLLPQIAVNFAKVVRWISQGRIAPVNNARNLPRCRVYQDMFNPKIIMSKHGSKVPLGR